MAYGTYPFEGGSGGGSGTVTSVGLALPPIFTVTGSPVTTSGTLTATFNVEPANTVFAGPASGPPASPTFRVLVAADLPTGGNLTDVGTDGIVITGGTGAVLGAGTSIAQQVANASQNGYLPSVDWNTFNSKQPAGNYITALTGDVTASGPGSAAATLASFVNRVYVDFGSGNDSTGTGTPIRPWKTLQHAYNSISPTINEPYTIYLSGGNNSTDISPITGKPNVALFAEYSIQVPVDFIISGGSTNDQFWALNIEFIGAFTWSRSDATDMSVTLSCVAFGGATTIKQAGSGGLSLNVYSSSFDAVTEIQAPTFGSLFFSTQFNGATTFDDVTSAAYYEFMGGYIGAPLSIAGGPTAYFSGIQADVPFGYTLTAVTTGNGTPTFQTDAGSIPPTITGTPTLVLTSYAQHESYIPAIPGNWSPVPDEVASALDQLAARTSGAGTVSSVSVVSANGFAGTVANPTSTPAITIETTITGLLKGNGTAISAATAGTDYQAPISTFSAPSNEFLTGFTAPNTFTAAQPAFSNLSGNITAAQMLALPSGDVYIGNGSNQPVAASLTAGSGITITPGPGSITIAATGGSGTVTSVALADGSTTPIYSITGSPVTASGTLTFSLDTQSANTVFAGPTSGSAAQPTFRGLVSADIPNNAANTTGTASNVTGTVAVANGGTGDTSFTAYAVITGGTTSTGALQNVSGVGTSGQVLTSNGAGALPTWQTGGGGGGSTLQRASINVSSGTADANTTLLLNFDGGVTGGFSSSTIYDYGINHLTGWSLNLGAVMDTTHPKFGVAAVDFTVGSSGANISRAGHAAFALGSGNFELDAQVYPVNFSATYDVMGVQNSGVGGWDLYINTSGFPVWYNSLLGNILVGTTALTLNTYNHVEVDRSGTTVYMFVNGVLSGTATDVSNYNDSTDTFHVGANSTAAGQANGLFVDEVRISNIARNTSSFTAPTVAYPINVTINADTGSIISSALGGFGPGYASVTFNGGIFSVAPIITATTVSAGTSQSTVQLTQAATTTAADFVTYIGGSLANCNIDFICY